ncbi:MAG: hypothetical protein OXB99_07890 [Acidimicrobiaceae bacterium]|nr:hypothetical protein [Acidimicrobiaceae bacterium]
MQGIDSVDDRSKVHPHFVDAPVDPVDALVQSFETMIDCVKADIHGIEARIHPFEMRIHGIETSIHPFEARIHPTETRIHPTETRIGHSVLILEALIDGIKARIHLNVLSVEKLIALIEAGVHQLDGALEAELDDRPRATCDRNDDSQEHRQQRRDACPVHGSTLRNASDAASVFSADRSGPPELPTQQTALTGKAMGVRCPRL